MGRKAVARVGFGRASGCCGHEMIKQVLRCCSYSTSPTANAIVALVAGDDGGGGSPGHCVAFVAVRSFFPSSSFSTSWSSES